MKTKISIFIIAIIFLLLGTTTTIAQGTNAYFKKNGVTVFQSAIADIDSIVFKQDTTKYLFISLNSLDPLLCRYTQGNKSYSFYGTRDENGMPSQLEDVFVKDENDSIIMQIHMDEQERPIKFITDDNSLICEYDSDRTLLTLTTKDGMIYSGEMDTVIRNTNIQNTIIQKEKTNLISYKSLNNAGRKCIIQVTNCGQPFNTGNVYVVASMPYPDDNIIFETFPTNNIGGGLYECTIPDRTAFYINPDSVCEWTKEKVVFLTKMVCFFGNPGWCPLFVLAGGVPVAGCLAITGLLEGFCGDELVGLDDVIDKVGEVICSYVPKNDWYLSDMKLTPHLNALPYSIIGNSVVVSEDEVIPNLSIQINNDCDQNITPTLIMSNIQKTTASAYVNAIGLDLYGLIDEIGVCYSSSNSDPTVDNGGTVKQQKTYGSGSATSLPLDNLIEGTKYYIRPYVKNNNEIYQYGDVQTFTTLAEDTLQSEEAQIRAMLVKLYHDTDGDNWADNLNWLSDAPISTWFGIAYSPGNYLQISLSANKLKGNIDVSGCPYLTLLWCFNGNAQPTTNYNSITSINVSGCTNLQDLDCMSNNSLTTINASGCSSLTRLWCQDSQVTSLDASNCTNLDDLEGDNNQLKNLNIDGCTNLKTLNCSYNQLTSLNVKSCTNLNILNCVDNQLTSIDVSGYTNLVAVNCYDNLLTSLNVDGCSNLQYLRCQNNKILSEIPAWFTQLLFTYDIRYSYYWDNVSYSTKYTDNGVGWWYPGEPEKGYHAP